MVPFAGTLIFVILIVLDIWGHRKFRVGRKSIDWFFLCLFAAFGALFTVLAVRMSLPAEAGGTPARYLAYRYLMDGDADNARAVILQDGSISGESAEFLNMLADAVDGDYRSLYFTSERFAADPSSAPAQKNVAKALNTLAAELLEGGKAGNVSAEDLAEESFNASGITETVELREYYETDSLVRSGNAADADPEKIRTLPASFPEEEGVRKLAISYYVQMNDHEAAKEAAEALLKSSDSAANRIIYTDVLAQTACSASEKELRKTEDPEITALLSRSEQAASKAAAADPGSDQYYRQTESARQYLDSIPEITYQRIKNYIRVKKPFSGDKTGLYDLQLIKMDLLGGDTGAAYEKMQQLLERAADLDDLSPVKADLSALAEDLDKFYSSGDDEDRGAIFEDCTQLMLSQSEGVVMIGDSNINTHAARLLASELIYDRTVFEITGTDASSFPKVSIKLNTNLRKGNIFGGSGEFYKDDFKISENGESYSDFTLNTFMGAGDRCLVIAADTGMGDAYAMASLFEAAEAAGSSSLAKKQALIDGNAQTVCGFADSSDHYLTAARELVPEGTASSYDMILASAGLLEDEKTEDPAILLISDDLDLTDSQVPEISGLLKERGITLYILNLSGKNGAAGEAAAKNSGGLYFGLSMREELKPAVLMVRDLMNNGYVFTYKTTDDITGAHTVTITLSEPYAEDSEGYLQEVNS